MGALYSVLSAQQLSCPLTCEKLENPVTALPCHCHFDARAVLLWKQIQKTLEDPAHCLLCDKKIDAIIIDYPIKKFIELRERQLAKIVPSPIPAYTIPMVAEPDVDSTPASWIENFDFESLAFVNDLSPELALPELYSETDEDASEKTESVKSPTALSHLLTFIENPKLNVRELHGVLKKSDTEKCDDEGNGIMHLTILKRPIKNNTTSNHARTLARWCEYLSSIGCDVNAKNAAGDTPLHLAASRGYSPLVKRLCELGARSFRNLEGKTPGAIACSQCPLTSQLLKKRIIAALQN